MFKAIRVRYEKGVLKPLEPLELKEGEEVRARIERSLREVERPYRHLRQI